MNRTITTITKGAIIAILMMFAGFETISAQQTYTVQVPAGTSEVYIVGGVVGGWDRFIKLNQVDATTFSVTINNPGTDDPSYEYCAGPSWNYEECDANGTVYGIPGWSELDVVVGFVSSFNPGAATTYTVQVPQGTQTVYYEYNIDGWPNYVEMDQVDETTFSVEFDNNDGDGAGYAYCAGPSDGTNGETNCIEIDQNSQPVIHTQWADMDVAYDFMNYDVKLSATGIVNPTLEKTDLIGYSVNNIITVTGTFNEVSIYNVTGQKIQSEKVTNHFESNPVSAGIYLVKTDKQAIKVVVK
jgi:hypothetical protein